MRRTATEGLRNAVEAAVLADIEKRGPEAFSKDAIVRRFIDRGAGRSSLYRWVDAVLASGKLGERLEEQVKKATAARAKRTPEPAADATREVVKGLPSVVDVAAVAAPDAADVGIPYLDRIRRSLAIADRLIEHAQTDEGKPRNAKLLLSASTHNLHAVETLARVQGTLLEMGQVQRFHRAIFDMLRQESPAFAERVAIRMKQLNVQWSGI